MEKICTYMQLSNIQSCSYHFFSLSINRYRLEISLLLKERERERESSTIIHCDMTISHFDSQEVTSQRQIRPKDILHGHKLL